MALSVSQRKPSGRDLPTTRHSWKGERREEGWRVEGRRRESGGKGGRVEGRSRESGGKDGEWRLSFVF